MLLVSVGLVFGVLCLLTVIYHWFGWNSYRGGSVLNERVWVSSFECGFLGISLVENLFSYTYFVLLVFFVVFDLEISLLLNMPYQGELFKNFEFYVFFLIMVGVGYSIEVLVGYVGWVE